MLEPGSAGDRTVCKFVDTACSRWEAYELNVSHVETDFFSGLLALPTDCSWVQQWIMTLNCSQP